MGKTTKSVVSLRGVRSRLGYAFNRLVVLGIIAVLVVTGCTPGKGDQQQAGAGLPDAAGESTVQRMTPYIYLPSVSGLQAPKPDEAVLSGVRGIVSVRRGGGEWMPARQGDRLAEGAQIRTGALSSAAIILHDGSEVVLGPQAEIILTRVAANKDGAARAIILTQVAGESEHWVAKSTNPDSVYEVVTQAAKSTAKGTAFKVTVQPDSASYVSVFEGEVAVTGRDTTVLLGGGQATSVNLDEPPADPVYFFTGEGEVTQTGETWVIGGQTLVSHPGTTVVGDPQVGDWVFFEGRLQPDDTRLVDVIVLLHRSAQNEFSLTGHVDAFGEGSWTVNGQVILVTPETVIDEGIVAGDLVHVTGLILEDGSLQAERIQKLEDIPGVPFDITGLVEAIGDSTYTISGVTVTTTPDTVIDEGIVVGSLVRATGWVLPGNVWQASSIRLEPDQSRSFEFIGAIQTIDPWVVAGKPLVIQTWSVIDPDLVVGDQVRVKGEIMPDGTWVASEIRKLDDLTEVNLVLVGRVTSMEPWTVSGTVLNVDAETIIEGTIVVGMLVQVEVEVLEDGTWRAVRISPLDEFPWEEGCKEVEAVVTGFDGSMVQLEGYPAIPLSENAQINGELIPGTRVLVQICYDEAGNPVIVTIYILLEPVATEEPGEGIPEHKVMVCHKPDGPNPHEIVIAEPAVPAHLGHGDYLGPCVESESPDDDGWTPPGQQKKDKDKDKDKDKKNKP